MYGAGMPILYPIGLFSFIVLLYVERFTLVKLYRKPPNYGVDISLNAADQIRYLSIFLNFSFGFWLFSNRQLFEQLVNPKNRQMDVLNHGHFILSTIGRLNPGTPYLLFLGVYLIKNYFEAPTYN